VFRTIEELEADLVRANIARHDARLIAEQARPAVWLETELVSDDSIALAATKIGGRPDLPAGVSWPIRPAYPNAEERTRLLRSSLAKPEEITWATPADETRRENRLRINAIENPWPLDFVAQINFEQMWQAGPLDPDMPRDGLLSIFYDVHEQPWGFEPRERMGYALLYHQGPGFIRSAPPVELAEASLEPHQCTPHRCVTTLPPVLASCDKLLPAAAANALWHWWCDTEDDSTQHRVGGWPTPLQGDMQAECAFVAAGVAVGYGEPHSAESEVIRARATDWLLLAQFGSFYDEGFEWGLGGRIYLWITRSDLIARRFDRAHVVLQCY
jgi:uncharacterized protein YwqG